MRAAQRAAAAGLDTARWPDKLPVADRLAVLLDPGSWVEDGLLANAEAGDLPADGVRTGTGRIDGRTVAVIAHDFAVKAGSWGALTCEKQIRILERADRDLLPVIYLVDSAGGRLTDQLGFFSDRRGASRIFQLQIALSGRVPQLCCLLGPSAAGGAYMPAFTDWVGMVEGNASMYLASPAGRRDGHRRAHHAGGDGRRDDARDRLRLRRRGLPAPTGRPSPPPGCCCPTCPRTGSSARPPAPRPTRTRSGWAGVIPDSESAGYDVREVIDRLVDAGSFFEIKARWAQELVIGLARLGGEVVGLVANQPQVRSGAIFVDSADKAARFITLCDAFNIPLLFLHDVPGFMVGVAVERQGIIRHGAKMITAMASAEVPKLSVILRKSYAAGYYAMCAPGFEPRASIALPGAVIGPMSAPGLGQRHVREEDRRDRRPGRAGRLRRRADRRAAGRPRLLRVAADLVVDTVVEPERLRDELIARLARGGGLGARSRGVATTPSVPYRATISEVSNDGQPVSAACHSPAAAARAVAVAGPGRAPAPGPGAARAEPRRLLDLGRASSSAGCARGTRSARAASATSVTSTAA